MPGRIKTERQEIRTNFAIYVFVKLNLMKPSESSEENVHTFKSVLLSDCTPVIVLKKVTMATIICVIIYSFVCIPKSCHEDIIYMLISRLNLSVKAQPCFTKAYNITWLYDRQKKT